MNSLLECNNTMDKIIIPNVDDLTLNQFKNIIDKSSNTPPAKRHLIVECGTVGHEWLLETLNKEIRRQMILLNLKCDNIDRKIKVKEMFLPEVGTIEINFNHTSSKMLVITKNEI